MHWDQHGHPGPCVDHSSERSLDDVWRISRTVGNTLKGLMMVLDSYGHTGSAGVLMRGYRKSSVLIRSGFGGFRKVFQSEGNIE